MSRNTRRHEHLAYNAPDADVVRWEDEGGLVATTANRQSRLPPVLQHQGRETMTDMVGERSSNSDVATETADEMAKYNIVRKLVDYFHVGEFRYENLPDAIAEAKRRLASPAAS
jgi:hypothetical protein